MSAPKLYLILISGDEVANTITFRELDSVQELWGSMDASSDTGVVHCGFVRPRISGKIEIPDYAQGKILYSGAVKWGLPDYFKSTNQPITYLSFNNMETPCYLALNEWGYELPLDQDVESDQRDSSMLIKDEENLKDTISSAAQQVLNDVNNRPLNKEEIYALIIESNYYQFNTPKPVHVLDVTLNRETLNTKYSKAANVPVFGKTKDGRYFLLGDRSIEPKGWVRILSNEEPALFEQLHELSVSDDDCYLAKRSLLSDKFRVSLDNIRFDLLKTTIDLDNPHDLLQIAPLWLLDEHIKNIGFSIRVVNVLLSTGISKMQELSGLKVSELARLPNMGKRSIRDMCESIIKKVASTGGHFDKSVYSETVSDGRDVKASSEIDSNALASQVAQLPLRQHLDRTLDELSEVDRLVLHGRLGYKGKVLTLEELANKLDVTRERIRQRQKKYVEKIIAEEYWDDVIGARVGQLLFDRTEPLVLELLEIEDPWFQGFSGKNYTYLANVIQMFSENAIQVINAERRNVITRISQKAWDLLVRDIKASLKQKAKLKIWTRSDVNQYIESRLSEHSAKELSPLIQESVGEYLQYEDDQPDAVLVAYGKSAESVITAVLSQADEPLHFTEIANKASSLLGKPVDVRRAHSALARKGVWLFDRGTYGLIEHCPLPESKRLSIRNMVESLLYEGPINKQWHSKEIIEQLNDRCSDIPGELDPYVLRMCIEESDKINFLNRMVWARSDSGLNVEDRVGVAEAFIQILEEAGEPLSGQELKDRLSETRGVDENMQIHPNDRLVAVGKNIWGLSEWVE